MFNSTLLSLNTADYEIAYYHSQRMSILLPHQTVLVTKNRSLRLGMQHVLGWDVLKDERSSSNLDLLLAKLKNMSGTPWHIHLQSVSLIVFCTRTKRLEVWLSENLHKLLSCRDTCARFFWELQVCGAQKVHRGRVKDDLERACI